MSDDSRADFIVDVLVKEFGSTMSADPAAFRQRFRKMASSAFAFYRGSAALFYADLNGGFADDAFLDERTSRVWIHGDLHAENFGGYLNSAGVLTFNVNDFDEAYVGPFLWDLKRLAASMVLVGFGKVLSDENVAVLVKTIARSYLAELRAIAAGDYDPLGTITLDNATGPLLRLLQRARLSTRVDLLSDLTTIDNNDRRLLLSVGSVREIDDTTTAAVTSAFARYLATLRGPVRPVSARIKDIKLRTDAGIGSAGIPSYSLLLEGDTQTLDTNVILYMKQARTPAVARWLNDERVRSYFRHQGHRVVESQRALQTHADPWLGFAELNGTGHVVAEVSPYAANFEWSDVNRPNELIAVMHDLGRAVARMHSMIDDESSHELVDFRTEEAITAVVGADADYFVNHLCDFARRYGEQARTDHQIFVDLFRNGRIPGL